MSEEFENQSIIAASGQPGMDWRARTLIAGGIIGTILGIVSAYLYIRAASESHGDETPEGPQARDAVQLGLSVLGIIRTITDWGRH